MAGADSSAGERSTRRPLFSPLGQLAQSESRPGIGPSIAVQPMLSGVLLVLRYTQHSSVPVAAFALDLPSLNPPGPVR